MGGDGGQPGAWTVAGILAETPHHTSPADNPPRKRSDLWHPVAVDRKLQGLDVAGSSGQPGCSLPAPAQLCFSTEELPFSDSLSTKLQHGDLDKLDCICSQLWKVEPTRKQEQWH